MPTADAVVVGGGLLGLASAAALARRGLAVVVLEAEHVGHPRSGSKGAARIFRLGYADPLYVRMARHAHELWHRLAAESASQLLHPVGQVSLGRDIATVAAAMRSAGAPVRMLPAAAVRERFPDLRVDADAIFEPDSAVIAADAALAALARGLDLRTGVAALALRDGAHRVHVDTAEATWSARVAVVCAGAATATLLPHLTPPLTATLEQLAHFGPPDPARPILIDHDPPSLYGLPVPGSGAYKLGRHATGPAVDPATASLAEDPTLLAEIHRAARRRLPTLTPMPAGTERCVYDCTADSDFVLDRVGNIVVGAGTSGHGFKFGPLLGELLADLAVGATPPLPLQRFRAAR